MSVVTKDTIQPSSGQSLTIKDEGGTASITVATNGEATFAENIVIGTAGKGIDFSAQTTSSESGVTPDTSAGAEVLDHYEEGTWTPTITNATGYSYRGASYTKIGNRVDVFFYAHMSGRTSAGVSVYIGGLPFTVKDVASDTSHEGTGVCAFGDLNSFSCIMTNAVHSTTTLMVRYTSASGSTAVGTLAASEMGTTGFFKGSITYITT
jgi:hypothetical protein